MCLLLGWLCGRQSPCADMPAHGECGPQRNAPVLECSGLTEPSIVCGAAVTDAKVTCAVRISAGKPCKLRTQLNGGGGLFNHIESRKRWRAESSLSTPGSDCGRHMECACYGFVVGTLRVPTDPCNPHTESAGHNGVLRLGPQHSRTVAESPSTGLRPPSPPCEGGAGNCGHNCLLIPNP